MSCNILVVGHIRCLRKLCEKDDVTVGLLTAKALRGYKKELVPFEDRYEILDALNFPITIVPQFSLDPTENLIENGCTAIASGDGFEKCEKEAAKKLKIKLIKIKSGSKIHSRDLEKCY